MGDVDFVIVGLGIKYYHQRDFCINRPHGSGDYVFIHFRTPVEVHLREEAFFAPAGACIFYSPDEPTWYRGHGVGLGNDWFHCEYKAFETVAGKYGVPLNRLLLPGRSDFVVPLLSQMRHEMEYPEKFGVENICLIFEQLLLHIGRELALGETTSTDPRKRELLTEFRRVRSGVHEELTRTWSVGDMADMLHLSESRFSVLYKQFFRVSPVEDLLRARLERAKWLLANTSQAISDVAAESGFDNIYYFSRIFRRRSGLAPRDYRNSLANPGKNDVR